MPLLSFLAHAYHLTTSAKSIERMKEFASLCRWCRRNLIVDVIKFSLDLQPRIPRRQSTCPAQCYGNGAALLFVDIVQVNWPLLGRCRRSSPGSDSTMSHIMLNPLPSLPFIFFSSRFRPRLSILYIYINSAAFSIFRFQFTNPREPSLLGANLVLFVAWNLSGPRRKGGTTTFAFSRRRVTR